MEAKDFEAQNSLKNAKDNDELDQMKDIFHVTKLGLV